MIHFQEPEKKSNIVKTQIQQQLFVIFHFSFNLKNFYFEFSKEGAGHQSLKHTLLTEYVTVSFNVTKMQNLHFQYFVNYKSKYNHVPLGVSQLTVLFK